MRWIIPFLLATTAEADMLFEDFSDGAEARWQYVSDRVMGGVSDGGAVLGEEDGVRFALLSGIVSTQNNGGFIQLRRVFDSAPRAGSTGIRLSVRGQNGPYFVHIRTSDTRRPWHYYQASFPVSADWTTVDLPWSSFSAKGNGLPRALDPARIKSMGLVAYGRDHTAELSVRTIVIKED